MAKYQKVCLHCGKTFETDCARRLYCPTGCSYEVLLKRRPEKNRIQRQKRKNREKLNNIIRDINSIAAFDCEAKAAGMTYGQYEAWQRCQREMAARAEERKQGIRFLDRFKGILQEECSNGELQQRTSGV